LDSDDKKTSDSCFEFDEDNSEIVEEKANRLEIQTDSNLHDKEHIETKEDKIAIEQREN
jgi:hypothetical protein